MTEAEKTEAAILKAKADKITSPRIEKKVAKAEEVKISDVKKVAQEDQTKQVDIKKYPFNVKLGKNKEVNFKPWTGKTKKKFRKLFIGLEEIEDLDLDKVVQVLIRDNLSNSDIYLSDIEQQYLTALLRKESLEDEFEYDAECEHCEQKQHIKTSVTDSVSYRPNLFPSKNEALNIEYIDIESNSFLLKVIDEVIDANDYDGLTTAGDVDMALHLKIKDTNTPLETLDAIDDMPLKDLQVLLDGYDLAKSEMIMNVEKNCTMCGKSSTFKAAEIPGLFENLLN